MNYWLLAMIRSMLMCAPDIQSTSISREREKKEESKSLSPMSLVGSMAATNWSSSIHPLSCHAVLCGQSSSSSISGGGGWWRRKRWARVCLSSPKSLKVYTSISNLLLLLSFTSRRQRRRLSEHKATIFQQSASNC